MKIWRFCHRFDRSRGPAQAWLSRIAHHHAVSSLRLRSARPSLQAGKIDDENPYEHVISPGPGPEDHLIDAQRRRAVKVCLLALPKGQREALALAFFDELSHREVAERLSRPLGTVKSNLRRGMLNMNATLEAYR
jgi:RNA polymerase sigma-70 factor (ECF subfamily)